MRKRTLAMVCLLTGLGALPVEAATIRVELDGSGDHPTIQAAIDAASPGDVIELGPGRYTETHTVFVGNLSFETHAFITVDDLTIRGVDRDLVIIGPETGPPQILCEGIVQNDVEQVTVEDITFENLYDGISAAGDGVVVRGCRFVACDVGTISRALFETRVEGCEFNASLNTGLLVVGSLGSTGVLVTDCSFEDNSGGIDLQTDGNIVQSCTFRSNVVGMQFSFGASGSLLNCTFEDDINSGVALVGGSTCTMLNNLFRAGSGGACLEAHGGSDASGTGNTFEGGMFVTILLSGRSTLQLSDGHIVPEPGNRCVWTQSGQGDGHIIDLRNNYWGTNSAAEIAECITDNTDFPQLTGTVLFEPFSTGPVPTESTSFGAFRARFGRRPE